MLGLKLALLYKQILQVGLPYHPGQLYQLKCFVMRDILCNVQDLNYNLTFSMENTLNSRKMGKYYHRMQKKTLYCSGPSCSKGG